MLKRTLKEIKEKLSLTDKELSKLLGIKTHSNNNYEEKEIIEKIITLTNINQDNITNEEPLPLLKINKPLEMKKYKNRYQAYSEIIKKNYTSSWNIYVLTKKETKKRFTIKSIFKKKQVKEYLEEFTPSFLAINGNTKILINFKKENLIMIELDKSIDENNFIIENIKYKKANKIKIDKNS